VFAFQNARFYPPKLAGLEIESIWYSDPKIHSDLAMEARDVDGCVFLYWLYNRDVFSRRIIEHMAEHYGRVIEALLDAIDQPIQNVDFNWRENRPQVFSRTAGPR
jgi:hypothetical protein